ncbi:MAG: TonB-dependent receptor plug domain-containing protein [Lewinellaceae bacterium]|nr:TonB-dependent receptor plug domain-containing protein [Phaeodactylibacter sp.]MCB9039915.1 TonB-dependent receptor plug domain-containing protein [Lewinellaceae bacterium]
MGRSEPGKLQRQPPRYPSGAGKRHLCQELWPGGPATTSIRGGSAGQATVLWNGLPLQSPLLGELDLALLPLAFTELVEVQYGGNSSAWGSGAIGGVVGLGTRADFERKAALSLRSTLGSFGLFDQQAKAHYGQGRWRAATRLFHRWAANDFPYLAQSNLPERKQPNARLQQSGFLQEFYWRPAPGQQLAIHVWLQQSEREIPPTTVLNISRASQADRFARTALNWRVVRGNVVWQARAGLFRENLHYRDEQIRLSSFTQFWTAMGEIEGE